MKQIEKQRPNWKELKTLEAENEDIKPELEAKLFQDLELYKLAAALWMQWAGS